MSANELDEPDWFLGSDWAKTGRVISYVEDSNDCVLALIDMNSNGKYVSLEIFGRTDGRWFLLLNQDDVGDGPDAASEGWSSGQLVWSYGHAEPGTIITLEYESKQYDVISNSDGLWGFVRQEEVSDVTDTTPRVVSTAPPRRG